MFLRDNKSIYMTISIPTSEGERTAEDIQWWTLDIYPYVVPVLPILSPLPHTNYDTTLMHFSIILIIVP